MERNEEERLTVALARAATTLGRPELTDPGEALTLMARKRVNDSAGKIGFERALEIVYEEEPEIARAHINANL